MSEPFLAAAIQLRSTEDIDANLASTRRWVERAAALGARLVAVPENFAFLRIRPDSEQPHIPVDHPIVADLQALAARLGIDLLLGSLPEPAGVEGKVHNTSVYLRADGSVAAAYRKLHLFDVDIPGQVRLRESDWIVPGSEWVVADGTWARVGLSICYDLRFPELYRRLVGS